jgi:uncharacterized protein YvpB
MKTRTIFYTSLLLLLIFNACDKTDGLKKKLKGTYEIESYKESFVQIGCTGSGNFTNFEVPNPGKIIFTNKRTIQGPTTSSSHKTYIGYFDYNYSYTDINGQKHSQEERSVFQYEFQEHSGGAGDTVVINFYDKTVRMSLLLDQDEKGNIVAFKYQSYKDNCYIGTTEHIVKK